VVTEEITATDEPVTDVTDVTVGDEDAIVGTETDDSESE
jgi:hypothetical protein